MSAGKHLSLVLLLFVLANATSLAQKSVTEDGKWVDFIYELIDFIDSEEEITQLYNELSSLLSNPINVNSATKEDLEKYPFLSDRQVESLLTYRDKYGPMVDPYELRLVPGFDYQTINYFIPFIVAEKKDKQERKDSLKEMLKWGRHELQMRGDVTLQEKKGYAEGSDSLLGKNPNARYLGEPFYSYVKYDFSSKDRLQIGLLAEKDRGEPLFTNSRRGFDFYSGHLVVKDIGALNTLALGHYRVSFGQGLIINNDFSFGKSSLAATAYKRSGGIKRHHSTDESNYLQGIAAAFNLGRGILSAFYSFRSIDGIGTDSIITSIKTDGLHNLYREENKRSIASMQAMGGDYTYKGNFFKIGVTGLYYQFSKSYEPTLRLYNDNYFRGKNNYNVGIHYEFAAKGLKFFGETAISKSGGIGTLNGLLLSPISTLQLSLLQRYYAPTYHAYYSKAFGEASQVIDEMGLYMSFQWSLHRKWTLSGYLDVYKFATPHYGIDAPSSGYDFQAVVNYSLIKGIDLSGQYRHRTKPKNWKPEGEKINRIGETDQDRFKIQMRAAWSDVVSTKTNIEAIFYRGADRLSKSNGWIVGQQVSWKPQRVPFVIDGYIGLFQTDDYWSSVYSTEKSLLYTFSVPKFYGKGYRLAVNIKYQPIERIAIYLKYGRTHYFDRDLLGTDLEEISGNARDDLYLLVRCKF